jgi:predicted transcriptional regulator
MSPSATNQRENMTAATPHPDLLNFAAQIVAAHVSHNAVSPEALPAAAPVFWTGG